MSLLDNAFGISAHALVFQSQRSSVLAGNINRVESITVDRVNSSVALHLNRHSVNFAQVTQYT